jgi:hypothetical protein
MSDFFQHGLISTLHRLVHGSIAGRMDNLLPGTGPTDLLLPCQYAEIGTAALDRIVDCLGNASFLSGIVISMNGIPDGRTEERAGVTPILHWVDVYRRAVSSSVAYETEYTRDAYVTVRRIALAREFRVC